MVIESEILALTVIKQLGIAVPSIIVGTQTITSSIKGIFKIENKLANRILSWIIAILVGLGFVVFNGLAIVNTPVWVNYLFGGICGLFAGFSANGLYNTDPIWNLFNAITNIFNPERKARQLEEKSRKVTNGK